MNSATVTLKSFSSRAKVLAGSTLSMLLTDLLASAGTKTALKVLLVASLLSLHPIQLAKDLIGTLFQHISMGQTYTGRLVKSTIDPKSPLFVSKPKQAARTTVLSGEESNREAAPFQFHTFEKDYTCLFTGKVTCGGGPCESAEIEVHVVSLQNPEIVKSGTLQPDGTYQISVPLRELLNGHVDWWIVAGSPEFESTQIQGRHILTDESTIRIETPFRLL